MSASFNMEAAKNNEHKEVVEEALTMQDFKDALTNISKSVSED